MHARQHADGAARSARAQGAPRSSCRTRTGITSRASASSRRCSSPGNQFTVYGPGRSPRVLEGILEGQMNPHFSPLYTMQEPGRDDRRARPSTARRSRSTPPACASRARAHPHGATHGARLSASRKHGRSFVYASDAGYPPRAAAPETCDRALSRRRRAASTTAPTRPRIGRPRATAASRRRGRGAPPRSRRR